MTVNGKTTLAARSSPSGQLNDQLLPIYGSDVLTTGNTHYLLVGGIGDSATEALGQVGIPEDGILRRLTVQNTTPGGTAVFAITYNVRKNGAPIPGATKATTNEAADPIEIDINVPVHGPIAAADAADAGYLAGVAVPADLISVEVVVAEFGGGTTPVVRSWLVWTPGAAS